MSSIGSYTLILNEARWIAAHLLSWLPVLDEMVFYDGGSRDGTVEIIEAIAKESGLGHKIKLFKGKNPHNLESAYERMFNECMRQLGTDYAAFIHPDMLARNPEAVASVKENDSAVAMSMRMESYGGDPDGKLYRIVGRSERWKNIARLRNPDLGAHYFGAYGSHAEDVYFSEVTGDEHKNHAPFWEKYPYEIEDSGLEILHFSDVRTPRRRYERMVKCLVNQGHPLTRAEAIAMQHPRVTLKDSPDFHFTPTTYPPEFISAREKYRHLEKELTLV